MKRKFLAVMVAVLVAFAMGCAGMLGQENPLSKFANMSPKGKATVAMKMYNSVFKDVEATLASPTSTKADKQLAMEKLRLLVKYQDTVTIYNLFIDKEAIPNPEDEEALIKFVDELLKKGVELL